MRLLLHLSHTNWPLEGRRTKCDERSSFLCSTYSARLWTKDIIFTAVHVCVCACLCVCACVRVQFSGRINIKSLRKGSSTTAPVSATVKSKLQVLGDVIPSWYLDHWIPCNPIICPLHHCATAVGSVLFLDEKD